jgi:hypothetical protein
MAAKRPLVNYSGVTQELATADTLVGTHTHAESDVTALTTDLAAKAPLISPTFTGTPAAPAPSAGTNTTQIATTAYAMAAAPNASYRVIEFASGSHIAGLVAGTYMLPGGQADLVSGASALYPITLIPIFAADYPSVNGLAVKLKVRAIVSVNGVAPTGNFTVGLYPVTSGAGGAGVKIYSVGSLVSGSAASTVTAPASSSITNAVGSDFAIPSDGIYCLAVVTTATIATSSLVHIVGILLMRNA